MRASLRASRNRKVDSGDERGGGGREEMWEEGEEGRERGGPGVNLDGRLLVAAAVETLRRIDTKRTPLMRARN